MSRYYNIQVFSRDKFICAPHKWVMNTTDPARFFIVYPMDLEDLGLRELEEKFKLHNPQTPLIIIAVICGGIEIECPLYMGLNLNRILRTPTRILLRLAEFKCRDAPKLYQKMSKFNWAPWLLGQIPEVTSAAKNSRLFDSRKIDKAIQDGVAQYYRHKPVKKRYLDHLEVAKAQALPKIYFRTEDDSCTLSIDTTGERMHLRGEKILTGLAPIRENLAALLLIELRSHVKSTDITLIDPMSGSGTFLIEAKNSNKVTENRDFSFLHMPLAIDSLAFFNNSIEETKITFFQAFVGFDINAEVVAQSKINAPEIDFSCVDLFSKSPHTYKNPVVIMNPPYGIRVGENINLEYFYKIIESVKNKFNPEILGIIIPDDYKMKTNSDFKILKARPFKNGGIEVTFYVLGFK